MNPLALIPLISELRQVLGRIAVASEATRAEVAALRSEVAELRQVAEEGQATAEKLAELVTR